MTSYWDRRTQSGMETECCEIILSDCDWDGNESGQCFDLIFTYGVFSHIEIKEIAVNRKQDFGIGSSLINKCFQTTGNTCADSFMVTTTNKCNLLRIAFFGQIAAKS